MKQYLEKMKEMVLLLPAICIAAAAIIGFLSSTPVFKDIELPGAIPEVQAAVTDTADAETADDSNVEEVTTGEYTDGEYTGVGCGYSGDVKVKVIVENGKITSVEILSSVDDAAFMKRASHLTDTITEKQTWEVDAVSEATYSSRGICEAVRNALTGSTEKSEPVKKSDTASSESTPSSSSYSADGTWKDGTFTGSAKGYGGTISVSVTIKNKKITDITVTSHSGETKAYYNRAKAIIKKIIQKQSPNVDTISGATYSSTGIKNAVINALKRAEGKTVKDSTGGAKKTSSKKTKSISDNSSSKITGKPKDGTYHVSAKCSPNSDKQFSAYTISCDVTFKNGKLVSMKNFTATGAKSNKDFYTKAIKGSGSTKGMVAQLIAKQSTSGISAISGATCSSLTIKNLYLKALEKATGKKQKDTSSTSTNKNTSNNSTNNNKTDTTTKTEDTQTPDNIKDGTYTGSAEGYSGSDDPIKVSVTVKDGKITAIVVTSHDGETPSFYNKAKVMVDRIIAAQSTDVDTVSGATYSSTGIKNAVAKALEAAKSASSGDKGTSGSDDKKTDDSKTDETTGDSSKTDETTGDSSKTDETTGDSSKTDETTGDSSKTDESGDDQGEKEDSGEDDSKKDDAAEEKETEKEETFTLSTAVTDDSTYPAFDYDLYCKVTVKGGKVTELKYDHTEDYMDDDNSWYVNKAIKKMADAMISKQSADVDIASGATYSSKALKDIFKQALKKAAAQ